MLFGDGEAVPKEPNGPPELRIVHVCDSRQEILGPLFEVLSLSLDARMAFHFEVPSGRVEAGATGGLLAAPPRFPAPIGGYRGDECHHRQCGFLIWLESRSLTEVETQVT